MKACWAWVFAGCLLEETQVGPCHAVAPTIGGTAWITGFASHGLDLEDPFPQGFMVGISGDSI